VWRSLIASVALQEGQGAAKHQRVHAYSLIDPTCHIPKLYPHRAVSAGGVCVWWGKGGGGSLRGTNLLSA